MKNVLLGCCMLMGLSARSQGLGEWFHQKKTKLKLLAEQIVFFQTYTGYVQKGYSIAKEGLSAIDDIKHGDFDLHHNYFSSLSVVNPLVKTDASSDSVFNQYNLIIGVHKSIEDFVESNAYLQADEKDYAEKVISNLLGECNKDMDQFLLLVTDSAFSLKDDERLIQLKALYSSMKDKYAFAKYFQHALQLLTISRSREANDIKSVQSLNGLK